MMPRILENYKSLEVKTFSFKNQWWQECNKEAERCFYRGSPSLSLFKWDVA